MSVKGFPVVVVEEGGAPFVLVETGAPVATLAENGLGLPITPVTANAPPLILTSDIPPIPPGPLDVVQPEYQGFNNFEQEFGLASDAAILGLVCIFDGDPVPTIEHGGEPLTIVKMEKKAGTAPYGNIMSLLAVGTGLTVEVAPLTITCTGGNMSAGSLRINEMKNVDPALTGWEYSAKGQDSTRPYTVMSGTDGGIAKFALGTTLFSGYVTTLEAAKTVWTDSVSAGKTVPTDYTSTGSWTLGTGWAWDGDDLVHTGSSIGTATLSFTPVASVYRTGVRAYAEVGSGAWVEAWQSPSDYVNRYSGPLEGYVGKASGANVTSISGIGFRATGNVRLSKIAALYDASMVTWLYASIPAEDGTVIRGAWPGGPSWALCGAEVLGEDY